MSHHRDGIGDDLTAVAIGSDRFERGAGQGRGLLGSDGLVPIYLGDHLIAAKRGARCAVPTQIVPAQGRSLKLANLLTIFAVEMFGDGRRRRPAR